MEVDEVVFSIRDVFNGTYLKDILKTIDLEKRYPGLKFGKIYINSYEIEDEVEEVRINFNIKVDVKVLDCEGERKASREYIMKNRALISVSGIHSNLTVFGTEDVKKSMILDGCLSCRTRVE